jgi:sarcosine oxidase subunit alpha
MSPTLGRSICLGQVDATLAAPGTELTVRLPDGRDVTARVTAHLAHVDPDGLRQQVDSQASGLRPHAAPVARSPIAPGDLRTTIADWEVDGRHSRAALTIADHTPLAKIGVRGRPDGVLAAALGTRFGRTARDSNGSLVIGSGPGEWLVLGEPGSQDKLLPRTRTLADETGEFGTVIDLTHGRAMIRLTGADCAGLLAKVCGIELSDEVVPDGAALRTAVANLVTDVVRVDRDGVPSYLLHCERSSGQYLFDTLLDAGREFGIEIDGCPISPVL